MNFDKIISSCIHLIYNPLVHFSVLMKANNFNALLLTLHVVLIIPEVNLEDGGVCSPSWYSSFTHSMKLKLTPVILLLDKKVRLIMPIY